MFNRFFLEWKMRSPLFRWSINAAVAILVYIAATIGGSLGIQGIALEFSVVWPATGFSLAAVLLFGFNAIPGVFLGNFLYNFLNLVTYNPYLFNDIIAATFVSLGSTFQAILGGYIMRHYSSYEYFKTLKDVFIFLIPAGLLTCMVASTIGNFTIFLYGGLVETNILYAWITFWLGDLMGIYIFTPLLVVWALEPPSGKGKKHLADALLIGAAFLLVSYATFVLNYRLTHLYLPLCIWATYSFSMHGATLMVFLTTVLTIVLTSLGYGPFTETADPVNPLLFLVSFLNVTVFTTLIMGAIMTEREEATVRLKKKNTELQEEVHRKIDEVRNAYHEMVLKDKKASLSTITFEITKQIISHLDEIRDWAAESVEAVDKIRDNLKRYPQTHREHIKPELDQDLTTLHKLVASITKSERDANRIAKLIQEHIARSSEQGSNIKTINLHTLLNQCIENTLNEMLEHDEHFTITVDKNYDRNVTSLSALPWELAFAFRTLINQELRSLRDKWVLLGENYTPRLEVDTLATDSGFDVVIRDNGPGASEENLKSFFHPFIGKGESMLPDAIGLFLAHEIIVAIHHGKIQLESEEGQYLHMRVTLPRTPY